MSKTYHTLISLMLAMLITSPLTNMIASLIQFSTDAIAVIEILIYVVSFTVCMKDFEKVPD